MQAQANHGMEPMQVGVHGMPASWAAPHDSGSRELVGHAMQRGVSVQAGSHFSPFAFPAHVILAWIEPVEIPRKEPIERPLLAPPEKVIGHIDPGHQFVRIGMSPVCGSG